MFFIFSISIVLRLAVMHGPGQPQMATGRDVPGSTDPVEARLVTPTPSPSPTLFTNAPDCGLRQGTIIEDAIPIPGQVYDLAFHAYLPPCYDPESPVSYPTLYFLHGLLGDDRQWEQAGALDRADSLFSNGVIPPFIIIMPWERTGMDLEAALISHLVPYVDQTFHTQTEPDGRGIGGLSRGGGQALQIGLKHPDVFGQISLHSPAVLNDDGLLLGWLRSIPANRLPFLWIDIGQRDSLFPTTLHLVELLLANGYAPTTQINPGDHELAYWRTHVETYLRWHAGLWLRQQLRMFAVAQPR